MPNSHDLKGLMKFLSRDEWRDCFEDVLDDHFGPVLDASNMEFDDLAEMLGDHWAMTLWGCAFEDFLTQDCRAARDRGSCVCARILAKSGCRSRPGSAAERPGRGKGRLPPHKLVPRSWGRLTPALATSKQNRERPAQGLTPAEVGKPAPLVPAVTRHDRSIEDVAREKAMPTFETHWRTTESMIRKAFRDPDEVAGRLRSAIIDQNGDGNVMAKAIAAQPERFGDVRGKTGLFGDNKERKEALGYIGAVASHVRSSADDLAAPSW